jgi:hypothetical protein
LLRVVFLFSVVLICLGRLQLDKKMNQLSLAAIGMALWPVAAIYL